MQAILDHPADRANFPFNTPLAARLRTGPGDAPPMWVCLHPDDDREFPLSTNRVIPVVSPSGMLDSVSVDEGGTISGADLHAAVFQHLSLSPLCAAYWMSRHAGGSEPRADDNVSDGPLSCEIAAIGDLSDEFDMRTVPPEEHGGISFVRLANASPAQSLRFTCAQRSWLISGLTGGLGAEGDGRHVDLAMIGEANTNRPMVIFAQMPEVSSFHCFVTNNISEAIGAFGDKLLNCLWPMGSSIDEGVATARLLSAAHYAYLSAPLCQSKTDELALLLAERYLKFSAPADCAIMYLVLSSGRHNVGRRVLEKFLGGAVSPRPLFATSVLAASRFHRRPHPDNGPIGRSHQALGEWLSSIRKALGSVDTSSGLFQELAPASELSPSAQKKTLAATSSVGFGWLQPRATPPSDMETRWVQTVHARPAYDDHPARRARTGPTKKTKAIAARKRRTREKLRMVQGHRPRLTVHRSNMHIYAQVIDDERGITLAAADSRGKSFPLKHGANVEAAAIVGQMLGERAVAAGVREVVFDRGEAKYHGRVKALGEAARDSGLRF